MNHLGAIVSKIRENFDNLGDILLFLRISALVMALPVLLKILSIPRLMKLLTPRTATSSRKLVTDEVRDKIIKYTDYLLSRDIFMFRSTCLRRSLVLYHFLRQAGIDVQICMGVRYKGPLQQEASSKELEGHAWLLYKGEIFLERNVAMAKEYRVTYCYPAEGDRASEEGLKFTGEKS